MTPDDIDQIVEGIEHFCIGPSDPEGELDRIWRPYIDKLKALKTIRTTEALGFEQDKVYLIVFDDSAISERQIEHIAEAFYVHGIKVIFALTAGGEGIGVVPINKPDWKFLQGVSGEPDK